MAINLTKTPADSIESNKLILCGLLMTAIDGEVDESELEVVFQNPYWSNLAYEGCSEEFLSKLKDGSLIDFCRNEVKAKLKNDADKHAFINGMIHVILADGVVDDNEVALLNDLTSQCGISQNELSERIAIFSSSGDNKLILCALLMTAIDGDIDDAEIQVVFKDAYWTNFFYDGCVQEFSKLLNEGGLIDLCKNECREHIKTNAQKLSFVHGLLKVILADGVVDENETSLLVEFTSAIGISSDELTSIIQSYGYVSNAEADSAPKSGAEENKLILVALLMTAIDGDIDDSEVDVVLNDSYWGQLVYDGCVDEFKQLIDNGTILDCCRKEVVTHVKTQVEKKRFVDGLVKIVLADGVVDANEVSLLVDLTKGIGITEDELTKMINDNAPTSRNGEQKWFEKNWVVFVWLLLFWPVGVFAIFKRLQKK